MSNYRTQFQIKTHDMFNSKAKDSAALTRNLKRHLHMYYVCALHI